VSDGELDCGFQTDSTTDYEFCYDELLNDGVQECTDNRLNIPDAYISTDPGAVSATDAELWLIQRATCGNGKFNKIYPIDDSTNGGKQLAFECVACNKDNFMEGFNGYSNHYGLKIEEVGGKDTYQRDSAQDSNKGVVHGNCCVNNHHSVCQAMIEEFKIKCEASDAQGKDAKGTGVQCLADGETKYSCTGDNDGKACPAGQRPTGRSGSCSCV
jgi:hypothetical protein